MMKTANIVSTMASQITTNATQKNNTPTNDENSFNVHFNREMNSTNSTKVSNKVSPGNNKTESTSNSNNDNQISTSESSSTKNKNTDDQKNSTNQDESNPLMLLFGAMSTVPKLDSTLTNEPVDTTGAANANGNTTNIGSLTAGALVQDPNSAIAANIASGTTQLITAANKAATSTNAINISTSNTSAIDINNAKINDLASAAANKLAANEADQNDSKTNLFSKTLSEALTTNQSTDNVTNNASTTVNGIDTSFAKIADAVMTDLQNKNEKLSNAITPQDTTQIQNIAQAAEVSATVPNAQIAQPFGSTGWDKAVGQKVLWMVGESIHSAELSLNPPDLGPLQIVLKVSNEHASASFMCAQPEVREALEQSMPKLRQMMSDAGIQLSSFSVNTQASNQEQQGNSYRPTAQDLAPTSRLSSNNNQIEPTSSLPTTTPRAFTSRIGEVDTFA